MGLASSIPRQGARPPLMRNAIGERSDVSVSPVRDVFSTTSSSIGVPPWRSIGLLVDCRF